MTIHISFVLFEILGIHHSVIFPPNTSTEKKKKKRYDTSNCFSLGMIFIDHFMDYSLASEYWWLLHLETEYFLE